ncbi:Uncharacterised protein [Staphylococcus aureus]|nr:Uncharacterised protein [Staphylococcus aureus]CPM59108.1 Uncharacterised protein [Staphylococcus aureus]CPM62305.1 Uncharacterised protein [Staphylococcus aureus]
MIRFFLPSSAIPTGLTSNAANASANEYSNTTIRFASLGTFTVPFSSFTEIVSLVDDSFLLELSVLPQAATKNKATINPNILKVFRPLIVPLLNMYNFIYYFIDNNYHCQVAFNLFILLKCMTIYISSNNYDYN